MGKLTFHQQLERINRIRMWSQVTVSLGIVSGKNTEKLIQDIYSKDLRHNIKKSIWFEKEIICQSNNEIFKLFLIEVFFKKNPHDTHATILINTFQVVMHYEVNYLASVPSKPVKSEDYYRIMLFLEIHSCFSPMQNVPAFWKLKLKDNTKGILETIEIGLLGDLPSFSCPNATLCTHVRSHR